MSASPPETKLCERCGAAFERPRDYSQRQWRKRRFCGRLCAAENLRRSVDISAISIPRLSDPRIISRTSARALGLKYYFTGKPCKREHVAERLVSGAACVECGRAWRADNPEKVAALKTAWAKANPKKRAASNRAWHEANREKNNATKRSWKKSNPEKVRAWANAWDKANPEKKRAWGNAWYAANRERVATNSRAWKKANPEKKRAAEHRRRARKRSILGEVTAEDIKRMMAASSKCHFCKKPFTRKRPLTIDHVLPISSHLGSNDPNNLVLACASCNSSKGARRYNPRTGQGLLV